MGKILDADGIAFLLDEFEDVALARRLSRNQAAAYTTTLRQLLDAAQREDLWIILSTTPEGFERTSELDDSLVQRFSHRYDIPELSHEESYGIVAQRLKTARINGGKGLLPFSDDVLNRLQETNRSSPRRLIKVMWHAIGLALEREESAPLTGDLVKEAEEQLYPGAPEA